jgi:hypothetical protein
MVNGAVLKRVYHQTLHALAIDVPALLVQLERDLPAAVVRSLRVQLVDQPHQFQIFVAVADRLVIQARTRKAGQLALTNDAQLFVIRFDPSPLLVYRR